MSDRALPPQPRPDRPQRGPRRRGTPRPAPASQRAVGTAVVAARPAGGVQEGIPPARSRRDELVDAARRHVAEVKPVPPLSLEELAAHTDAVLRRVGLSEDYRSFAAVIVNNEAWRETLAGIPYDRRLLLLPQCLRDRRRCPGEVDELGLLCRQCGSCRLGDFQAEARRLGYVVLVAEGTTVVTSLIQQGKVDAVVGVSCLAVLERVFPHVEAAALPGIAIPLLRDGCGDTDVDSDWVWEALYLTGADATRRLDLTGLRREVESWFAPEALSAVLGAPASRTEQVAQEWLARAGKRWRPFLAVCAFQALQDDPDAPPPEPLRKLAVAVECFHKASLIHDDIEDGDEWRYGEKALHAEHGVPIALNVGDFLLGEGYRLIGEYPATDRRKARMLAVAAHGHRQLTLGQGAELTWRSRRKVLSVAEVLDIFRRKTAPAFEVALRLGAAAAGALEEAESVLGAFSSALGIAYQVRDDLRDGLSAVGGDVPAARPSVLLALACSLARGPDRRVLDGLWRGAGPGEGAGEQVEGIFARLGVEPAATRLMEDYKQQAIRSLRPLASPNLKGLLRRVVGRIFGDDELTHCCREHQAGNAAGRGARTGPAA